jgi:hypothetical protein
MIGKRGYKFFKLDLDSCADGEVESWGRDPPSRWVTTLVRSRSRHDGGPLRPPANARDGVPAGVVLSGVEVYRDNSQHRRIQR